jgi:hypothetical protein
MYVTTLTTKRRPAMRQRTRVGRGETVNGIAREA